MKILTNHTCCKCNVNKNTARAQLELIGLYASAMATTIDVGIGVPKI